MTFSVRGLLIVIAFVVLLFAWVSDRLLSNRIARGLKEEILRLESVKQDLERRHDKHERVLIGQLKLGDRIETHSDFLKLADEVVTPVDPRFELIWEYVFDPDGEKVSSRCVIYIFDLEFDRIEGTNEFFVLVIDGVIKMIERGASVNS